MSRFRLLESTLAALSVIGCTNIAVAKSNPLPPIHEGLETDAVAAQDAAVLVGIEAYPFLPDVPYAKRDVEAFRQYLLKTRGVPDGQVAVLDSNPTTEKIVKAVSEAVEQVGSGGTLWIYFSGHGAASPVDGRRLLLGVDTQPDPESFEARSVSADDLESMAGGSPAENVVVVVDACYTGVGRDGEELLEGHRFAVPNQAIQAHQRVLRLSATRSNETSVPYDKAEHGLFTYFLVGALRGWADGESDHPKDGQVTLAEIDAYVDRAVRVVGAAQHPTLVYGDSFGNWAITTASRLEPGPELTNVPRIIQEVSPDTLTARLAELTRESSEMQTRATTEWSQVEKITRTGRSEGRVALNQYMEIYTDARVEVGGESVPVDIPELEKARTILAQYDVYWKKRRQRQGGTVLTIFGGVAAGAGFALAAFQQSASHKDAEDGRVYPEHQDLYRNWTTVGVAIGATGSSLAVIGVINLIVGNTGLEKVAVVPGQVTTVVVRF